MRDEAGILQQRVEAHAFERGGQQARERVRREDDEGEEGCADQALHGERAGLQRGGEVVPEQRDGCSICGQYERPEQHGTFMLPPRGGDLVEHRLGCVGVAGDDAQRKVRLGKGPDQAGKRERDQRELHIRR